MALDVWFGVGYGFGLKIRKMSGRMF